MREGIEVTVKHMFLILLCLPAYSDVFTKLKHLEPGKLGTEMIEAQKLVSESHSKVEARLQIEKKLVDILSAEDATGLAKRFACRELYRIGGKYSVPALVALLAQPELAQAARYALQGNRSTDASKALIEALENSEAPLKVGIIHSIGARRQRDAVPHLLPLLDSESLAVRNATLHVLGQIGGDDAIPALKQKADDHPVAADALITCAENLKDKKKAADIFGWLHEHSQKPHINLASLKGLLKTDPAGGAIALADMLSGENPPHVQAAALVRETTSEVASKVAALLPDMKPKARQMLLLALADRGEEMVVPYLIQAAKDKDVEVRKVALAGLRNFQGDRETVLFLLSQTKDELVADAAQTTLKLMPGPKTDDAILALLTESSPEIVTALVSIVVNRRTPGAAERLLKFARTKESSIRLSALNALREISRPADLPNLVSFLLDADDSEQRAAARSAAPTCAQRIDDKDGRAKPFIQALENARPTAAVSLLQALGTLGGGTALEAIRKSVSNADEQIKDAALRSLFGWQTSEVLDEVFIIAEKSPNKIHQVLALRACIRLLGLSSTRGPEETVRLFEKALSLAQGNNEKKKVLSGLAYVSHPSALKLAQSLSAEESLKAEAELAVKKIRESMSGPPVAKASHHPQAVKNALDGNPKTRWDTKQPMKPGMWFMLDLKKARRIETIELETKGSRNDYPRSYELYLSNQPFDFGEPVLEGKGHGPVTVMRIEKPVAVRYLKIVQTGSSKGNFWSIHTMKVMPEPNVGTEN